jgi:hypothetical protein
MQRPRTHAAHKVRLLVRPDVWGPSSRVRLSNAFGTRAITFDSVYVAEHEIAGAIVPGTTRPCAPEVAASVTVAPGQEIAEVAAAFSSRQLP